MNAHFQNAIYDTAKLVLSPDETRVRGKSEPESDEDAKFRRIALRRGIEKAIPTRMRTRISRCICPGCWFIRDRRGSKCGCRMTVSLP
jgi:hypothetical protein